MPVEINIYGILYSVATEEELLGFANRVRAAGGADPIPALLPSIRGLASSCLIARAVNFKSSVQPLYDRRAFNLTGRIPFAEWPSRATKWGLFPGDGVDVRLLANRLKLKHIPAWEFGKSEAIELPEDIGNAAKAFDAGAAFRHFALSWEDANAQT